MSSYRFPSFRSDQVAAREQEAIFAGVPCFIRCAGAEAPGNGTPAEPVTVLGMAPVKVSTPSAED